MKRFVFWFVLALVTLAWLRAEHRPRPRHWAGVRTVVPGTRVVRVERDPGGPIPQLEPGEKLLVVADKYVMLRDNNDEPNEFERVEADDLPVRVIPGTRTTEARIETPKRETRDDPRPARRSRRRPPATTPVPAPPTQSTNGLTVVTGRLSATEDRARADARARLKTMLAERLYPEVPRAWKAPPEQVDALIRSTTVKPVERDYGTVYEATLKVDLSDQAVSQVAEAYHRQQVMKRLAVLGALLAFVLICLAVVSGYIRADEATKGYYTSKLRLAAAAGVGAAGVVVYRMLA